MESPGLFIILLAGNITCVLILYSVVSDYLTTHPWKINLDYSWVKYLLLAVVAGGAMVVFMEGRKATPEVERVVDWGEFTSEQAKDQAVDAPSAPEVRDEPMEPPVFTTIDTDFITIRYPESGQFPELSTPMAQYLQLLAERVKKSGELIEVIGHTDNIGLAQHNLKLGQAVANATAVKLRELGVPSSQISTTSAGESNPMASNTTNEGRRLNRRVVVKVLPKE